MCEANALPLTPQQTAVIIIIIDFKITSFLSKCWYFRIHWQKTTFSKWSQNKDIFIEILIFTALWTRNDFLKLSQKTCFYVDIYGYNKRLFQNDLKITTFSWKYWYLHIFGQKTIFIEILIFTDLWTKNDFLNWSQKMCFSPKFWFLRRYGQKTGFQNDLKSVVFTDMLIVSDVWAKKIFKSDFKITSFSRNVDIYEYIGKNDFFKMISK